MKYNTKLEKINESELSLFNQYLASLDDMTLLTYGESDLEVNKLIKTQLIDSLLQKNDKYSPSQGLLKVRNLIANIENKRHNLCLIEENVLLTYGSTEALFLSLSSIINPDDEVLLPLPCYPLYKDIITYLKGKITYVKYDQNFQIDINDLKNKISIKTKAIILNYPNNPTGIYLNKDVIYEIKKLVIKYNVVVIIDNVYEEIIFTNTNNIVTLLQDIDNLVIVNSLSKSKSLTGWRLGYLIANKNIISLSKKLHEMISICMPHFLMESMISALTSPCNVSYYKNNADYVFSFLKKLKLNVIKPDGGFYVCFSIKEFNMDSITFCKYLAENYHLGLIPGKFFSLDDYVRISISCDYKKIYQGMKKLNRAIKELKRRPQPSN